MAELPFFFACTQLYSTGPMLFYRCFVFGLQNLDKSRILQNSRFFFAAVAQNADKKGILKQPGYISQA